MAVRSRWRRSITCSALRTTGSESVARIAEDVAAHVDQQRALRREAQQDLLPLHRARPPEHGERVRRANLLALDQQRRQRRRIARGRHHQFDRPVRKPSTACCRAAPSWQPHRRSAQWRRRPPGPMSRRCATATRCGVCRARRCDRGRRRRTPCCRRGSAAQRAARRARESAAAASAPATFPGDAARTARAPTHPTPAGFPAAGRPQSRGPGYCRATTAARRHPSACAAASGAQSRPTADGMTAPDP